MKSIVAQLSPPPRCQEMKLPFSYVSIGIWS